MLNQRFVTGSPKSNPLTLKLIDSNFLKILYDQQCPLVSLKVNIDFKQIIIERHFDFCYEFRRDSHFCSFGTYDGYKESVIDYQKKIRQRLKDPNWHYLHIWCDDKIIGQLEFKLFSFLESTGYVQLIYVIPEFRGHGVADAAEALIAQRLKAQGCQQAVLSVSHENERAIRHYRRFGWKYLKPNPKHKVTDYYIRDLTR